MGSSSSSNNILLEEEPIYKPKQPLASQQTEKQLVAACRTAEK